MKNPVSAQSKIPRGWQSNPSAWSSRWPLLALALLGFCVSSYLASFQLGWIDHVWDPFFGRESQVVLTSGLSDYLPLPDAALGALGYLADLIFGVIGGSRRWKDTPWAVGLFAFSVGPLGSVSLLLVMLQPLYAEAWCTLCLLSALISVTLMGLALGEILAALQEIKRRMRFGESLWDSVRGREASQRVRRLDLRTFAVDPR